jgi:surfeit locus 1 family protein
MALTLFGIRPLLWPTVMTVPAVLASLALGTWQVQRLHWKTALIAERQAQRAAPALAGLPEPFEPEKHEFRKARLSGVFLHDKELYLAARSRNGNAGYHVITPFVRAGGLDQLLVNRGWVPLDRKSPDARRAGQVAGTVAVEGYLRRPAPPGWFTPDNRPAENFWFSVDVAAMARVAGIGKAFGYILEADDTPNPGLFPIGGVTRFDIPNDHLQYAITWYSMAVIGLVIYLLYHRRRARDLAAGRAAA